MDVHQALHVEGKADLYGVFDDGLDLGVAEADAGVYGHRIATVDPGPFDVLHDAGNKHPFAVANGVHLDLFTFEVLVDKDGPAPAYLRGAGDVANQLRGVVNYLHGPAAEDVAGPHQNGIANGLGYVQSLLDHGDCTAGRLGNAETVEKVLEAVAVLGDVDGLGGGAENW